MNADARDRSSNILSKVSLIVGLVIPTVPVFGQPAQLEGFTFNAVTQEPVVGAKISLCEDLGDKVVSKCLGANTDREGRFIFAGCKAGVYYLTGESAGYLRDILVLDGHGTNQFDLRVAERKFVRLRLWPSASIKGRVLDERGRPMSGIEIAAIVETNTAGRRCLSRALQHLPVITDKNGEFQIGELKPGRYFLEAFAGPPSKIAKSILDNGYLPTYYPDASSLRTATTLCVDTGVENHVNFRLVPRTTYRVRGKLNIAPDVKRGFEPLTSLRNENGDLETEFTFEFDKRSARFVLGRLPPGKYEVEIREGIYDSDAIARRAFTIGGSDIDGLVIPLQRPLNVRAFVHFPSGFVPSTPYSVLLRIEREGVAVNDDSGWPVTAGGVMTLPQHFAPGRYKIYLFNEDSVYLKAATLGHQDVLTDGLLIDRDTTGPLDLQIANAEGVITGAVPGVAGVPDGIADVKLLAEGLTLRMQ